MFLCVSAIICSMLHFYLIPMFQWAICYVLVVVPCLLQMFVRCCCNVVSMVFQLLRPNVAGAGCGGELAAGGCAWGWRGWR